MVGGVHGHTCNSYEGNGDYRVAEDQGFRMTDDGHVQSVMAPEYCVTLGTQTVPGGGGSPVHQIREALLETCSEEKAHLQRWRLRDYKDW